MSHGSIAAGKPIQNGIIERYDGRLRDDGGGTYIQAAERVNIVGGVIGGDGKMQKGIHLGSGAQDVMISGVKVSDCDGLGRLYR